MLKIKKIFIVLLFVLSGTANAQENNRLFSPEELKADVDYYYEMLYSKHPNPYHYYSLNEFEDVKNRVYAQLYKPLTTRLFKRIINVLNSLTDRHSMIDTYSLDMTQTEADTLMIQTKIFLPPVKIKNGKVFFEYEHTQKEIIEINGTPVIDILSDMQRGLNWKLPHFVNFHQMELLFLRNFCFNYNFKAPFRIKFAGSNKICVIEGLNIDELNKLRNYSLIRTGENDSYAYKIYPDNSIAILYITTFDDSKKEQFEKTCNEFIRTVNEQKIKYIFYDVSMNGGGNHFGVSALDVIRHDDIYLNLTKIRREGATTVKKYRTNDRLSPSNYHDVNIPEDRKLFVLQGINTVSCASYFCNIVAENKSGVLVGQPTGEPVAAFSWRKVYEMPNTEIRFSVAEEFWDFSDCFKSETLNPDMYWDVNHYRDFTEEELTDIINHCEKKKLITNTKKNDK